MISGVFVERLSTTVAWLLLILKDQWEGTLRTLHTLNKRTLCHFNSSCCNDTIVVSIGFTFVPSLRFLTEHGTSHAIYCNTRFINKGMEACRELKLEDTHSATRVPDVRLPGQCYSLCLCSMGLQPAPPVRLCLRGRRGTVGGKSVAQHLHWSHTLRVPPPQSDMEVSSVATSLRPSLPTLQPPGSGGGGLQCVQKADQELVSFWKGMSPDPSSPWHR